MADAFLVVHHCFKPSLNSAPSEACGSSSAFLHPFAVQAVVRVDTRQDSTAPLGVRRGESVGARQYRSPEMVTIKEESNITPVPNACKMSVGRVTARNCAARLSLSHLSLA